MIHCQTGAHELGFFPQTENIISRHQVVQPSKKVFSCNCYDMIVIYHYKLKNLVKA